MIFGLKKLTAKAVRGVIVFTIVEVITLSSWLYYALKGQEVASIVVLAIGLLTEHYIATQVGQQDN